MPTPSRRPPTPRGRRTPLAIALVAAVGVWATRTAPVAWIETTWLHTVLPRLSTWSAGAIDLAPFSWTLAGIVALPVVLVVASRRRRLPWLAWTVALVAVAAVGFDLAWGVAYRRVPLEDRLGLASTAPATRDLFDAFDTLVAVARAAAPADASSVDAAAPWPAASWPAASRCVAHADAEVSHRSRPLDLPTTVRRLPAGTLLVGGFGGVVGPWLREPHVDGGLPPVSALATGLHELAHAAGWAGEAQTDALATLAGLACDADEVRFAAAVHGIGSLRTDLRRLAATDPEVAQELETRVAGLPVAVSRASEAARSASERYAWPTTRRLAATTYDAYLRSQGVDAGLADYGRASVLVTAALARCADDRDAGPCPARP